MKHNRTVQHDWGHVYHAPLSRAAERQTPAIRLGLFLFLCLVALSALSPNAPPALRTSVLLPTELTHLLSPLPAAPSAGRNSYGQLGDGPRPIGTRQWMVGLAAAWRLYRRTLSHMRSHYGRRRQVLGAKSAGPVGRTGDSRLTLRRVGPTASGRSVGDGGNHTCALTTSKARAGGSTAPASWDEPRSTGARRWMLGLSSGMAALSVGGITPVP
jgi:hypothetical protein